MDNIGDLLNRSNQIKNETKKGANTALRIGSLFVDLLDTVNTIANGDIVDKYDDTALREALNQLDTTLDSTVTTVNNEKARLDRVLDDVNSSITNNVSSLLKDENWVKNNAAWLIKNTEENQVNWQSKWDQNIEAYLQTVGVWSRDNNVTLSQWGQITHKIDSISSQVAQVQTDVDGKVSVSQFSTLSQKVNNLELTVQVINAKAGEISESLQAAINASVQDNISNLELSTTYASKDTETIVEWMYSGLKNSTEEDKTFSDLVSAGKDSLQSAISNIHTSVEKVLNGGVLDYVSETTLESKVNSAVAGLYSKATTSGSNLSLFSQVKKDSSDIATIVLSMTGDTSEASISTKIGNWKSGVITSTKLDSAIAGFITGSVVEDKLAAYVAKVDYDKAIQSLTTKLGNAATKTEMTSQINSAKVSMSSEVTTTLKDYTKNADLNDTLGNYVTNDALGSKNYATVSYVSNFVSKADFENAKSALWSTTVISHIGNIASDKLSDSINSKASTTDLNNAVSTVNTNLNNKASKTDLNSAVSDINDALDAKASTSDLNSKVSDINSDISKRALTTDLNNAISKVNSSIDSLTNSLKDTNSNLAGIFNTTTFTDALSAQISKSGGLFSGFITYSNADSSLAGIFAKKGDVSAASIVASINNSGESTVKISADKVTITDSFISKLTSSSIFADYLSAGSAEIKGNITATSGTIGGFKIDGHVLESIDSDSMISIIHDGRSFMYIGDTVGTGGSFISIRRDGGVGISVEGFGDNATAIYAQAQAGVDTRALETWGNIYFSTRSSEKIVFKGALDGVDANTSNYGYIDCRMPIKFNNVPICKVGGTLTLPAHPCNGMFFFIRECRVYANGHSIIDWGRNSEFAAKNGYMDVDASSTLVVYSSEKQWWFAFSGR